jgi:hypothetical protein
MYSENVQGFGLRFPQLVPWPTVVYASFLLVNRMQTNSTSAVANWPKPARQVRQDADEPTSRIGGITRVTWAPVLNSIQIIQEW